MSDYDEEAQIKSTIYNIILPIVIGCVIYFAVLAFKVGNPFYNTLGNGDLILISTMIIFVTHDEIKINGLVRKNKKQSWLFYGFKCLPIILILIYAVVKITSLVRISKLNEADDERKILIWLFSIMSIICIVIAIFFTKMYRESFARNSSV